MQEWMAEDTPAMDIAEDKIAELLLRDNEIMLDLIRELGAEDKLRRRIMGFQQNTAVSQPGTRRETN